MSARCSSKPSWKTSSSNGSDNVPNTTRQAYGWGHESGLCIIDGRRAPIDRPRARNRQHNREMPLGSYTLFQKASLVEETVWHEIMHGLTMRQYKEVAVWAEGPQVSALG